MGGIKPQIVLVLAPSSQLLVSNVPDINSAASHTQNPQDEEIIKISVYDPLVISQ